MTFLPIVDRELRVAARRRGTYIGRALAALVAIVLGIFLLVNTVGLTNQALGKQIFEGLAWLGLVYCLLAGRRSTADSLSEEKREGTLGLLFLTDLRGYDIVLGKVVATSLNAFYGLLAFFPVLAIPMLLGGVNTGEFCRVVLVLMNTFLLSLSIGIFVSALSRDSRTAFGANLLVLLLLIALTPALGILVLSLSSGSVFAHPLFYPCPIYTVYVADEIPYRSAKVHFWCSLVMTHLITWGFVGLASGIVPRSWQDKVTKPEGAPWKERFQIWTYGAERSRAIYRRRLLAAGAYYWLAARGRLKPLHVWVLASVLIGWWIWYHWRYSSNWQGDVLNPVNIMLAMIANAALKLWICIEAGRQLSEDRKCGAFELLLSTPLAPKEIIWGQWRALRRQFLWPALFVTGVELFFLYEALSQPVITGGVSNQIQPVQGALIWLLGILMLVADMIALGWVAMWMALTSRNANIATLLALGRILILPWIVCFTFSAVTEARVRSLGGRPSEWGLYVGSWFICGLLADLIFGLTARRQLHGQFRELASHLVSWRRRHLNLWMKQLRKQD